MNASANEMIEPQRAVLWDRGHHSHDVIGTRTFGFWLYMLSDAMIYAALFASYGVLGYGYAMVALRSGSASGVLRGIVGAMIFGIIFLGLVSHDIGHLFSAGITPERSGYLSIFFTLVIYHALHIVVGLLWMLVMLVQMAREGFSSNVVYRLINLKLFWHFQSVVWVFVFVFVYLQGVIA